MEIKFKLLFLSVILVSHLALAQSTSLNYEQYSREKDIIDENTKLRGDSSTTAGVAALQRQRINSARAYIDDTNGKREGYRYYGTGSRSGNSFAPTSIHKSTSSLNSHNYFVTTKGINKMKDMDTAGTSSSGNSDNNYLTEYESPSQTSSVGDGGAAAVGGGGGSNFMMMEEPFGDMASETGHSGGGYGHSGGGGGKGCNSALGLLGVFGLAAYLQNVLRNMPPGMAAAGGGGRRKRDVEGMTQLNLFLLPLNETSKDMQLDNRTYNKIMQDVFPLLGAVAHARDNLIPIHCTHSSVCLANQVLVQHLGSLGRSVGTKISAAIAKLLAKITKDERAEQIRMIIKAGKMGRNGRKCLKVFPTCNRLRRLPTYNFPSLN